MKKSIIMLAFVMAFIGQIAFAQTETPQKQLLQAYYGIKNALVDGNSSGAASNAEAFVKTANSVDYKVISEGNINILVKDAGALSMAHDLKKQRGIFASLSKNMAAVARAVKLTGEPIYKQYCPMKKAYWLSNEKAIRNPYFGNSMLTCGNVETTVQ